MLVRFNRCFLTLLFLSSAVSTAHASLIGPAADCNVFVFGNFTSANTDTEGNLAAGGNDLTNTNTVNISVNPGSTVLINVSTGTGSSLAVCFSIGFDARRC